MPADPTLKQLAERVEVELRQQVSDDLGADFDVELPPGLGHRPDFEALDAEVHAGGIIIAGVHYRREEVEAGRRLLRELGQSERSLRSVLEFVRRERVGSTLAPQATSRTTATPGSPSGVPTHRRIEAKRHALDRLARRWAELRRAIDPTYTWPKAQSRVNRAMGADRRIDATERQLDDGLAFLHSELGKLAQMYTEDADRLRIPGSLEAIDNRLHAAIGLTAPRSG
jgi:hypothetical protein